MRIVILFLAVALAVHAQIADKALAERLRQTIETQGLAAAQAQMSAITASKSATAVDEKALNDLGYRYLLLGKGPEALAVFKFNIGLFPQSVNVYDSYAEALVHQGDREGAIAHYTKSLELDPKNENAANLLTEIKNTPDGWAGVRQRVDVGIALEVATEAAEAGRPTDLENIRRAVHEIINRHPEADANFALVRDLINLSETVGLVQAVTDWRSFASCRNEKIAELAQSRLSLTAMLSSPVELKFTAVDGRAVDLAGLRGKLVLVDFWATWCGPCVGELPNLKATYAKYHDQGFEIVGVSLDRPKDRQKLINFCAEQKLPWPQFLDEKSDLARKFSVQAIPAAFLLDKSGRLVALGARGAQLEAQVRHYLGQP